MKRLAAFLAIVITLTGCSSGIGGAPPANPRGSLGTSFPAVPSVDNPQGQLGTSFPPVPTTSLTATDEAYLAVVRPLIPTASDDTLMSLGGTVCGNFRLQGTYADAVQSMSNFGLSDTDVAQFIHASIVAYCPAEAKVEAAATSVAPPPPPPMITFKVTSNGSTALVTYSSGTDISQDANASMPWTKKIPATGQFYQVSAQDADGTSITCEIDGSDGSVLDKNTSTGRYAIASCSS